MSVIRRANPALTGSDLAHQLGQLADRGGPAMQESLHLIAAQQAR
jgi:hypothetical protein